MESRQGRDAVVQHALLPSHSPLEKTPHNAGNGDLSITCGDRHCPKCQSLARAQWLEDRQSELLALDVSSVSCEPLLKAIAAIGNFYWTSLSLLPRLILEDNAMGREQSRYPKIPIYPTSDVARWFGGTQKGNKSLFSLLLEIESRLRAETRNEKIDQLFKRSKERDRQCWSVNNLSRYRE